MIMPMKVIAKPMMMRSRAKSDISASTDQNKRG
jgi:hypothetical protein